MPQKAHSKISHEFQHIRSSNNNGDNNNNIIEVVQQRKRAKKGQKDRQGETDRKRGGRGSRKSEG